MIKVFMDVQDEFPISNTNSADINNIYNAQANEANDWPRSVFL
jgi:hypothetical protein